MRQERIFTILALVVLIVLFLISNPQWASIMGEAIINSRAVQEFTSLSVEIVGEEKEVEVPASGNVTFSDLNIKKIIPLMTGLTAGWEVNISLYGKGYPSAWVEPEPNASEAGTTKIEYFEVVINESTGGGSYRIYFNTTQAKIGTLSPENISLFIYNNTGWTNLSTVIINGVSDPAEFYGLTSHFSKFLIGEKVLGAGEEEEAPPPSAPPGGGGGGGASGAAAEVVCSVGTIKCLGPNKYQECLGWERVNRWSEAKDVPAGKGCESGKLERKDKPKPVHIPGKFFDVSLLIPEKYRGLFSGEKLIAEINIINIQPAGMVGVEVEYNIEDAKGNIIFKEYETKTIENEVTYIKETELPISIEPGYHMFMVKVKYNGNVALAGYPFEIIEKPVEAAPSFGRALLHKGRQILVDYNIYGIGLIIMIIILLVLGAVIWQIRKKRFPRLIFIRK